MRYSSITVITADRNPVQADLIIWGKVLYLRLNSGV